MEEQILTLDELFSKFASEEDGMRMKDFDKVLRWIDIQTDEESLEEIFIVFDSSKQYKLSLHDFRTGLYNQKIDKKVVF